MHHCRDLSMRAQPKNQTATKRVVLHRKLLPLDDFGRLLMLQTAWPTLREPVLHPFLLWSNALGEASDARDGATAVGVEI